MIGVNTIALSEAPMRFPRLTTRRLMALIAAMSLVPQVWNEWSGRRRRYLELAERHALNARDMERNYPRIPYWPSGARASARMSRACRLAADRPYGDFLTGRWSPDDWFTPPDVPSPETADTSRGSR